MPPHAALGRHVKDGHVKDAAQGVAQDVAQDVPQGFAQDLAFGGPVGAHPPRHITTAAAAAFAQLAFRRDRGATEQLSGIWLWRYLGKRFQGCRAKRLYVDS